MKLSMKMSAANCLVQAGKRQAGNGMTQSIQYCWLLICSQLCVQLERLASRYQGKSRNPMLVRAVADTATGPRNTHQLLQCVVLLSVVFSLQAVPVLAQEPLNKSADPQKLITPAKEELTLAPAKVEVTAVAQDEEIRKRLQRVLDATDWFVEPQVQVEEGVVFLSGSVESDELKKWAGDLARNTQDVVAVANRLQVQQKVWDFRQAWSGVMQLWRDFIHALPFLVLALFILALTVVGALLTTRASRKLLHTRVRTKLLQNVIARAAGGFVVLCGVYLILRVSGLTQLALTLIGGTGLVGLIVGVAFRDITENFLASIFLSIQPPFETGDLVEISEVIGYVQQLNMRTTILMTLDGNIVQIPNSSVYKNSLSNFTSNANRRESFIVGIGYEDAISHAQEVALGVLLEHPAVLLDPEPAVLADSLGASTVDLRVYFWINGREYSWMKVRSSLIRQVKRAFQEQGISMPDGAREVVFPRGVPVTVLAEKSQTAQVDQQKIDSTADMQHEKPDAVSTAESGLYSEALAIEEQARQAQPMQEGENLLPTAPAADVEQQ